MSTLDIDHHQTTPAAATNWVLDPARSSVEFSVEHFWGRIIVKGSFQRFEGALTVDEDGGCSISLSLEAASIDTGNTRRDKHLRSDDFFAVAAHPQVVFRSTLVERHAALLAVRGELEAAGRQLPLSFEASLRELGDELEIEATTTADQRLLGMTWSPLGMLRTPSALHV